MATKHRHTNPAAFRFYSVENRQKTMDANPGLGFAQVAKKLEEDWKSLPEDERKKYEDMAARELERTKKAMAEKAETAVVQPEETEE